MPLPRPATSAILRNIARHVSLTREETEYFLSLLSHRRLRRRQYLLQEGDVCTHESYVVSGCLRSYFPDRDGMEHIVMIAVEDWWISDLSSFIGRTPSRFTIDALEDSELLQIPRAAFDEMFVKVPSLNRLFRILLQNAFIAHEQRILDTIALTAEERYENFAARHPSFLHRIPQKHIAAYLGMTPEFLSRIRARRAKAHKK